MAVSIKEFFQHAQPTTPIPHTVGEAITHILTNRNQSMALSESELMHAINAHFKKFGQGTDMLKTEVSISAFVMALNLLVKAGKVLVQDIPGSGKHYALPRKTSEMVETAMPRSRPHSVAHLLATTDSVIKESRPVKQKRHRQKSVLNIPSTLSAISTICKNTKAVLPVSYAYGKYRVPGLHTAERLTSLLDFIRDNAGEVKRVYDVAVLTSKGGRNKVLVQHSIAKTIKGVRSYKGVYVYCNPSEKLLGSLDNEVVKHYRYFIKTQWNTVTGKNGDRIKLLAKKWKALTPEERAQNAQACYTESALQALSTEKPAQPMGASAFTIQNQQASATGDLGGAVKLDVQPLVKDVINTVYAGMQNTEGLLNCLNQLFFFGRLTKWDFRSAYAGAESRWDLFVMRTLRYVDSIAKAYSVDADRVKFENGAFYCELVPGNKK